MVRYKRPTAFPIRSAACCSVGHKPPSKEGTHLAATLAEKIIEKLNQPGNVFSVITFGSQSPVLVKSRFAVDEAIAAVRDVALEQTGEKIFSVHLYDAVNLAFGQFTGDGHPESLLVTRAPVSISTLNEYERLIRK